MCLFDCFFVEKINHAQVDDGQVRTATILIGKAQLLSLIFQCLRDIIGRSTLTDCQRRQRSQHYYGRLGKPSTFDCIRHFLYARLHFQGISFQLSGVHLRQSGQIWYIIMRDKVGIPAVQQQEISLGNNTSCRPQSERQISHLRKLLFIIAFLLIMLVILVAIILARPATQTTSKQQRQPIVVNQQDYSYEYSSKVYQEDLQKNNIQTQNQTTKVPEVPVESHLPVSDQNKTFQHSYQQNLLKNREIYSFLKKRISIFMNHLSPYLKMTPSVLKEQIGSSQITNQQFGQAVRLMSYAPLVPNNSDTIAKALALDQSTYEAKYSISSYPQYQFCVVVPTYKNANKFRYFMNLYTIMQQDYEHYHVVIVDDASQDHTADKIEKQIQQNPFVKKRVTLVKNQKRQYHMANIYKAVYNYCRPGQILTIVDGDDELVGRKVFKLFNAAYRRNKAFTIYSNYIESKRDISLFMGISQPYPMEIIKNNTFRQTKHYYSHLKTVWTDLFFQIKEESLKSKDGQWYNNAVDNAIFLSIFEMACGRIHYLPEITYKYNTFTGNNIAQKDYKLRKTTADEIRWKQKYRCINQTRPNVYRKILGYLGA